MQVTGTIRSVLPTQQGGYNGTNGYIYTFDMVVDSQQGTFNGEIGSKSQVYPLGAGQPITVEVSDTPHGPRLKKVNPQYANQNQQQQAPRQQAPHNPPQQAPPAAAQQPDWDEIARGKVRCNLVCAGVQSGQIKVSCEDEFEGWMNYIFNGVQVPGGGPNPNYNPNPPQPPAGSEIPF